VNRHNVATIATTDLRLLRSKRSVAVSIVAFPALVAVGLPLVVRFAGASQGGIPASVLPALCDRLTYDALGRLLTR